ncbi:uncharacterized protein N7511_007053 [Penicillium nucicola]|uniref:uncharacterized protein n=1 Tax=Penicillium nucicola TaxID=1850975 RepID=UPI002545BB4C|nr:uncharacterized protein N7511_007053 [Penicillium nucicola]KAJ5758359.1 hypothetical protein N7511_007053 [Penicillium nucicola]
MPLTQVSVPLAQLESPTASSPHALRDRYIEVWSQRLALSSTPRFLGATSFSAVYSENEASLKGNESTTPPRLPQLNLPSVQNSIVAVDPRQIQLGTELLSLIFEDLHCIAGLRSPAKNEVAKA